MNVKVSPLLPNDKWCAFIKRKNTEPAFYSSSLEDKYYLVVHVTQVLYKFCFFKHWATASASKLHHGLHAVSTIASRRPSHRQLTNSFRTSVRHCADKQFTICRIAIIFAHTSAPTQTTLTFYLSLSPLFLASFSPFSFFLFLSSHWDLLHFKCGLRTFAAEHKNGAKEIYMRIEFTFNCCRFFAQKPHFVTHAACTKWYSIKIVNFLLLMDEWDLIIASAVRCCCCCCRLSVALTHRLDVRCECACAPMSMAKINEAKRAMTCNLQTEMLWVGLWFFSVFFSHFFCNSSLVL